MAGALLGGFLGAGQWPRLRTSGAWAAGGPICLRHHCKGRGSREITTQAVGRRAGGLGKASSSLAWGWLPPAEAGGRWGGHRGEEGDSTGTSFLGQAPPHT